MFQTFIYCPHPLILFLSLFLSLPSHRLDLLLVACCECYISKCILDYVLLTFFLVFFFLYHTQRRNLKIFLSFLYGTLG